ncbi:hypothetical protein EVAR_74551_1 [Eumeta japonica]|uniref:Uncharacterized protein n=1 Tax=Eumeta variegata TaxID=151549 RepID=A0A4C1TCR0_EUMVA|nr:hypothetical protein EVAR_74551_1 [Eumeta japonica]
MNPRQQRPRPVPGCGSDHAAAVRSALINPSSPTRPAARAPDRLSASLLTNCSRQAAQHYLRQISARGNEEAWDRLRGRDLPPVTPSCPKGETPTGDIRFGSNSVHPKPAN